MSRELPREEAPPPSGGGRVRMLPDALVDQIAAGEVVERPASVVKELVENAVDAGAGRLRVEVRAGGAARIAVSDDGCGMTASDARLAVQRHATSKLRGPEDLGSIATFGFRGEALPAIASVARVRLRTRTREATEAHEIHVDAGRVVEERVAGGPAGTRVEVDDLFAGVPARRKFLKSETTEWRHVIDWITRAALALPEIHFEVQRDGRPALSWAPVRDPLDRVASVLSERDAASLVRVGREQGRARLAGFASRPERHRASPAGIYLFVNGRPVRDRLLRHALVEVYRDVLPRGRFPTALLYLELPPEEVDVNVHPAKWEVRFADPRAVHHLVRRALGEALESRRWLGSAGAAARGAARAAGDDLRRPLPPGAWRGERWHPRPPEESVSDWILADRAAPDRAEAAGAARLEPEEGVSPAAVGGPRLRFASGRLLGQLLCTYLLVEASDGLLLVDQHAAHERVLYERLRAGWREGGVPRQPLLLTEPLELEPAALETVAAAGEPLESLGFEIEPFGEGAVAVRAIPALLSGRDPAELVRGLADELAAGGTAGAELAPGPRALDAADRIFATLACHAARRKGDRLGEREQRALLADLDAIPWAPTCPHGRPVAVPIDVAELERRFARR